MIGKEPCKKAKDVNSIEELGLSSLAEKMIGSMSPEDLILSVRNYEIYKFIPRYGADELNAARLVDEIEKIVEYNGFLRDDVRNRVSPESHFVDRYVVELNLMGSQLGKCMPFYDSNEVYETYVFSEERLERILDLLRDYLTEKQFKAVKLDIFNPIPRKGGMVREAKGILVDNREEIGRELCRIFA